MRLDLHTTAVDTDPWLEIFYDVQSDSLVLNAHMTLEAVKELVELVHLKLGPAAL